MKQKELLYKLKNEARKISNDDLCHARALFSDMVKDMPEKYRKAYAADFFIYLYEAFQDLKRCSVSDDTEVDEDQYTELLKRMDREYNIDDSKHRAFHRFVNVVYPYLTFIERKPIHPVGMIFPGGSLVTYNNGEYFCPVKNKQSDIELALCGLCVCEDSEKYLHDA